MLFSARPILLWAFLQTVVCFCYCQTVEVSVIQKKAVPFFINKYCDVASSSSLISFDSAFHLFSRNKFSKLGNKNVIFKGYDPDYYWYRFSISNSDTSTQNFVLIFGGLGIRTAETWQGKNNNWVSLGKTGYQYPFTKRAYPYVHHGVEISIPPMSTDTFYISIDESHAYKVFAFILVEPRVMKLIEHKFYFVFGLMTGLLLLFSLFNLYLYFSIKEKVHIWYALYIFTMLIFMLKSEGLDAEFLGLDSTLGYRGTYMGAVAILAIGFLLQVIQLFLLNIKKTNLLFKLFNLLKWLSWVGAIVQFIIFYVQPDHTIEFFVFQFFNKATLASLILILAACIYSFYKGFKPAMFILAGQLLFIIGGIARTLFLSTESHVFPPSLFEVGLVAEVVIISFGLMYRYNYYKKEKEFLKEKLEVQQVETGRQILFAQELEQKRIAQDLHDELGGNLAAIKMTLQSFKLPPEQSQLVSGLIDKASANARNISHNLMPPEFEETGLDILLDNHYRRLNTEGNTKFHFYSSGSDNHFDKQEELMIYRIVMELTNNITRHSHASEATIQLVYHEIHLEIMAEDNGRGFTTEKPGGIGLKNIYSRTNYLAGSVTIDSGANGTTIIIQIPYKHKT